MAGPLAAALLSAGAASSGGEEGALVAPEVEVEENALDDGEHPERFNLTPAVEEKVDGKPGAVVTTEEILESTPSVRVKSFGSFGSPSLLSLRGSDATHTLLLLDDIPLNEASSGLVDLSTVPSFLLESVTVMRGFSASAPSPFHPGGVVKFTTKRPEFGIHGEAGFRLGVYPLQGDGDQGPAAGQKLKPPSSLFTFGALRQIVLSSSAFDGKLGVMATASLEHAVGDFAFYSDNGTVYNPDDDRYLLRRNNAHASLGALFTLLYLPDMWSELRLSLLEFDRAGGAPGLDVVPASDTRQSGGRQVLSVAYSRFKDYPDVASFSARLFLKLSSLEWMDPLGEISNARQTSTSRATGAGVGLSGYVTPLSVATVVWGANAALEKWDGASRFVRGEGTAQDILRLSGGWSFTFFATPLGGAVKLQSSLRLDTVGDRILEGDEVGSHAGYFLSPGAAVEVLPFPWLTLSASVSRNHRPATLVELFGNGGVVIGNDALVPETSVLLDVGAVLDASSIVPLDPFEVEYRFFWSRVSDLITFIQNSQKTMVAQNIGGAGIGGVELSLKAGFLSTFLVRLGYTFLDPRDRSGIEPYDGRMLPNRPRHDLFFDASATRWGVTLGYRMDFLAGGFIDRASLRPITPRLIHSASVEWKPPRLGGLYLGLEVWNAGNVIMAKRGTVREAVADVDGYPLPGLGIFLSAGWRH
jgi:outer membrane receptor protein involved in Fe transport